MTLNFWFKSSFVVSDSRGVSSYRLLTIDEWRKGITEGTFGSIEDKTEIVVYNMFLNVHSVPL